MPELAPMGFVAGAELVGAWIDDLPLPLLVYRGALEAGDEEKTREEAEAKARGAGWRVSWTMNQGAAGERHCHTTTHEAVFVLAGQTRVRYGAAGDTLIALAAGDVAFHPAGAFHEGAGDSPEVVTAGAYPIGAVPWDWHTEALGPAEDRRIRALSSPPHPVGGGTIAELV